MAVTQELRTMFTADTSPLSNALGKLRKSAFMPVMVGAGVAAGATLAWYAASERTARKLDDLAKAARRTGLSGAEIQRYGLAAQLSGADVGALESAVKRMQRVVLDSERGMKTAKDTLAALGLTYEDLAGKSPDQQLRMTMEALAGISDSSRQAALAQELFGRSGTQLKPMLDKGVKGFRDLMRERDKIGPLFSDEQLASGEEMQDQILRNKEAFGMMIDQLVLEGFPVLMEGLEGISAVLKSISDNLETIKNTAKALNLQAILSRHAESMADDAMFQASGVGNAVGSNPINARRAIRKKLLAAGETDLAAQVNVMTKDEVLAALQKIAANTNGLNQLAN